MRDFKFKGYFDLQSTFAAIIKQRLSHIPEIRELVKESTIVPIPLHRTRQNERGFNQSEILARIITQFAWKEYGFDLKVVPLLHKLSANQHQSSSTVEERRTNVKGVYQMNEIVAKDCPKILIVDDVITTGSTVSEAIATISEWYSINRSTQPEINCMALFRGRAYFNKRAAPSQPVPTDYSTISAS
ncbi:MAG: hypothetical protein QY318_01880 [Candidatus Dojkabacteria bacterium]|nr:MAG: hypothetical protein QY318_01880 [Candidatus Dojkabacteria bacterium]